MLIYKAVFPSAFAGRAATITAANTGAEVAGSPKTIDANGEITISVDEGQYLATASNFELAEENVTTELVPQIADSISASGGGFILDGAITVVEIADGASIACAAGATVPWDTAPEGITIDGFQEIHGLAAGAYIVWVEIDIDAPAEDRIATVAVNVSGSGTGCNVGPLSAPASANSVGRALLASGVIVVPTGCTVSVGLRGSVTDTVATPSPADWSASYASILFAKIG